MGRAFSNSYLAGEPAAHAFFAPHFRDPAERIERARLAAGRAVPAALLQVLREQQASLPPSPTRQSNLDALAGKTAVVATGQQIGLFWGIWGTLVTQRLAQPGGPSARRCAAPRAGQAQENLQICPVV